MCIYFTNESWYEGDTMTILGNKNKMYRTDKNENFQRIQIRVLYSFCILIITISTLLASSILVKSNDAMQKRVASLVAVNSHQLHLNINSYLKKIESTTSLMFADATYYEYDATDDSLSEYNKIVIEEKIVDRIVDIGLMENFSDFSIIYANDHTVGWLSKTTSSAFPNGGIYETFSDCIKNSKVESAWTFGIAGNNHLYFIKRLNPNAVLVASVYNKELDSVFQYPEEIQELTIRLISENETILYSSEKDEIGEILSDEIADMLIDESDFTVKNDKYLVTSNKCTNGWRVVCTVSMKSIMSEYDSLKKSVIIITAICIFVFLAVGLFILRTVTKPVGGIVSNLENKASVDELSGLYNKRAFEETVNKKLQYINAENTKLFIMFDIDNFKKVNDEYGHGRGDEVIARMGRLLMDRLDNAGVYGRIGGDEFAYYRSFRKNDTKHANWFAKDLMDKLLDAFAKEFESEHEACKVSLSAGVCIADGNLKFEELYKNADTALYSSKNNGKNQYTIYEEAMDHDKKNA